MHRKTKGILMAPGRLGGARRAGEMGGAILSRAMRYPSAAVGLRERD